MPDPGAGPRAKPWGRSHRRRRTLEVDGAEQQQVGLGGQCGQETGQQPPAGLAHPLVDVQQVQALVATQCPWADAVEVPRLIEEAWPEAQLCPVAWLASALCLPGVGGPASAWVPTSPGSWKICTAEKRPGASASCCRAPCTQASSGGYARMAPRRSRVSPRVPVGRGEAQRGARGCTCCSRLGQPGGTGGAHGSACSDDECSTHGSANSRTHGGAPSSANSSADSRAQSRAHGSAHSRAHGSAHSSANSRAHGRAHSDAHSSVSADAHRQPLTQQEVREPHGNVDGGEEQVGIRLGSLRHVLVEAEGEGAQRLGHGCLLLPRGHPADLGRLLIPGARRGAGAQGARGALGGACCGCCCAPVGQGARLLGCSLRRVGAGGLCSLKGDIQAGQLLGVGMGGGRRQLR